MDKNEFKIIKNYMMYRIIEIEITIVKFRVNVF